MGAEEVAAVREMVAEMRADVRAIREDVAELRGWQASADAVSRDSRAKVYERLGAIERDAAASAERLKALEEGVVPLARDYAQNRTRVFAVLAFVGFVITVAAAALSAQWTRLAESFSKAMGWR